jgi:thioester reductase-like protein
MDLLLTGATGLLGAELLRHLAQGRPDCDIYVLLRAGNSKEWQARSDALLARLDREHACHVIPLWGDVALEDLGLGGRYREVACGVDEIYHTAACTRFDVSADYAARNNVAGTCNVLKFARAARQAGRTGRVHYVSTAFVSGRRTGCVTEGELDCGQQFFNVYEWSKFQAEQSVRAAGRDLPVTIYRPSVVVGNSCSGRAHRFLGLYQVLRWIHRGQVEALPCRGDFLLDLTPADYVAEAIVRLATLPDSRGKTFHLTAGPDNTLTLRELIDLFLRERQECDRPRRPERLNPIRFGPGDLRDREHRLHAYVPYLTCAKVFDDANTRAILKGLAVPSCREFFPRVARYALETGFRAE